MPVFSILTPNMQFRVNRIVAASDEIAQQLYPDSVVVLEGSVEDLAAQEMPASEPPTPSNPTKEVVTKVLTELSADFGLTPDRIADVVNKL